jgi:hypothetical protein
MSPWKDGYAERRDRWVISVMWGELVAVCVHLPFCWCSLWIVVEDNFRVAMRNDAIDGSSPSCEVSLSLFVFICPSADAHSELSLRTTYILFDVNLLETISKTLWKTTFTPFQPKVIDNPARIFRRLTKSVLLRCLSWIDAMHDDRLSDSCALKIVSCFGTDIECCEYLLIWQQPWS